MSKTQWHFCTEIEKTKQNKTILTFIWNLKGSQIAKTMKYLGINLTKEVKDLHTENF